MKKYAFIITLMAWLLYKKTQGSQPQFSKQKVWGEKKIRIYETYKNTVMPHGIHIYAKAYDREKATMCAYSQSDHALLHWMCILICCTQYPNISIPDQETDDKHTNLSLIVLIGQFCAHTTIGISFVSHQNKYLLRHLTRYIRWLLTE